MSAMEPQLKTVEDPEIAKRKGKRIAKKAAEDAAGLTIADRLTRRAKAQTVSLDLKDDDGEFSIVMRQPTRAEMDELNRLQEAIKEESTQDEANDRLCIMLDQLCIDGSLDYQFWMDGNYSMGDLIAIVQKLFESLVERVKAAQSFR